MNSPLPSKTDDDSKNSENKNNILHIGSDEDYSYVNLIKRPNEMKISNKGTMKQLGTNIGGIINYINLLVTGNSPASKQGGQPLGDAYFINTKSSCVDDKGNIKPRHFYINNVPPETSLMGRGLIGGITHDISELDPSDMLNSFTDTDKPTCSLRTFKVIDTSGKIYKETRYVADSEVTNYKDVNKYACRPDIQKKNGNKCCVFHEKEKSLLGYESDDEINCPAPLDTAPTDIKSGFRNRRSNPHTYYNRKKLDKHFKMFILFVILMMLIFI